MQTRIFRIELSNRSPMKTFLFSLLLLLAGCNCSGGDEVLISADIRETIVSKERFVEVTFQRELSECVNGVVYGEFAWTPIEVEDVKIHGEHLKGIRTKPPGYNNEIAKYEFKTAQSDPTYDLSVTHDGKVYKLDSAKAKAMSDFIRVPMKVVE